MRVRQSTLFKVNFFGRPKEGRVVSSALSQWSGKDFSPARMGTVSQFSLGGKGQT